jgi:hypothetical protein
MDSANKTILSKSKRSVLILFLFVFANNPVRTSPILNNNDNASFSNKTAAKATEKQMERQGQSYRNYRTISSFRNL